MELFTIKVRSYLVLGVIDVAKNTLGAVPMTTAGKRARMTREKAYRGINIRQDESCMFAHYTTNIRNDYVATNFTRLY